MLIAWQALKKRSDPHAERFANARSGIGEPARTVPRDHVRPDR
jgi:hypothetical protein